MMRMWQAPAPPGQFTQLSAQHDRVQVYLMAGELPGGKLPLMLTQALIWGTSRWERRACQTAGPPP